MKWPVQVWVPALALWIATVGATPVRAAEGPVVVDPLATIRTAADVEPAGQVLRLVGPRNGYCSAQVVAHEAAAVRVGDLRGPEGATLPAERLRIRYATIDSPYVPPEHHDRPWLPEAERLQPYYDVLLDAPPADFDLLPVWLTVHIPRDQPPGLYRGSLRIGDAAVPIELTVGRWVCPDPADWTTYVGLMQSPASVARQYSVERWSAEHIDLVEQSLRFAADLGNEMLVIPVYHRSDLGELPEIYFREGPDGLEPDFSRLEKHLAAYARVSPPPKTLVIEAWIQRYSTVDRRPGRRDRGAPVLVIDEKGEITEATIPRPGEPGADRIYGELFDGIRQRVLALGWEEDAIMIGWATDQRPRPEQVEMFERVAPTRAGRSSRTAGARKTPTAAAPTDSRRPTA